MNMHNENRQIPLGRTVSAPDTYSPEMLFALPRPNPGSSDDYCGFDWWRCYEVSWLKGASDGIPQAGVLLFSVPADTLHIVESKSVKLYLNSFCNRVEDSEEAFCARVQSDISRCIGQNISVRYFSISEWLDNVTSHVVDGWNEVLPPGNVPLTKEEKEVICFPSISTDTYHLYGSHRFRSLCPVTSQPDWATVTIVTKGFEIDAQSFFDYVTSFRNSHGFHEKCVTEIYLTVWKAACSISNQMNRVELSVWGQFTRRGGIDITPVRSSKDYRVRDFFE